MEATRVDRWLWAVRVFKTRSQATDACRSGHVEINGAPAKAASTVRVDDRVEVRFGGRDRAFRVVEVIDKRVGAPLAATCLVDESPPVVTDEWIAPLFVRDPATGRPTKRQRRQLDEFRSR